MVRLLNAVWLLAVVGGLIMLPVLLVKRLRSSGRTFDTTPDDMRRADDGQTPNEGEGQGLGPLWPTN